MAKKTNSKQKKSNGIDLTVTPRLQEAFVRFWSIIQQKDSA